MVKQAKKPSSKTKLVLALIHDSGCNQYSAVAMHVLQNPIFLVILKHSRHRPGNCRTYKIWLSQEIQPEMTYFLISFPKISWSFLWITTLNICLEDLPRFFFNFFIWSNPAHFFITWWQCQRNFQDRAW